MIPELIDGEVAAVFGPVASGKSYLMRQWYAKAKAVTLFDTPGEFDDLPGIHFWSKPQEYAQFMEGAGNEYKAVYHPLNNEEGFYWCANACWQQTQQRFLLCEEVWQIMSPHYQHPQLQIILKYGRKRGIAFVGTSQRIADTNREFTSAARLTILFNTQEVRDLDAASERWGNDTSDMVRQLRPLIYRDREGIVEQTPQAVVIRRGQKPEVVEIG